MFYKRTFVLAAASSALVLAAQTKAAEQEEPLEQVVVTGTRVANRSALDTAVPVDVVSSEQLQNVGVAEINQALARLPGCAPRQRLQGRSCDIRTR